MEMLREEERLKESSESCMLVQTRSCWGRGVAERETGRGEEEVLERKKARTTWEALRLAAKLTVQCWEGEAERRGVGWPERTEGEEE